MSCLALFAHPGILKQVVGSHPAVHAVGRAGHLLMALATEVLPQIPNSGTIVLRKGARLARLHW